MTINIIIIILFFLLLLATPFLILMRNRMESQERIKKGEQKEMKEEEVKKESSSTSSHLTKNDSNILNRLMEFVIIILVVFFLAGIGYLAVNVVGDIFSSPPKNSEIQEKSWKYCQKSDPYANEECSWGDNVYKVKKFINTNERTSFEVHWGLGHGVFISNAGSSENGTYHNFITGEKGKFEDFKETEKGFISNMTCLKNCNSKRYSFTIEKK